MAEWRYPPAAVAYLAYSSCRVGCGISQPDDPFLVLLLAAVAMIYFSSFIAISVLLEKPRARAVKGIDTVVLGLGKHLPFFNACF